MFSSEIKETIYVGIGLSLAAMVLALVAYVMGIRSDLASAQNELISTKYILLLPSQIAHLSGSPIDVVI